MTGPDAASWEPVIGLEVHVQLRTHEKLFCASPTAFGEAPNTHVCPVCLGLPGALPVLNEDAVGLALTVAVALQCRIHATSVFARKNYFYPDLPKGYQISQFESPLATSGRFASGPEDGAPSIRIRRIHMEEDAGKSLHDRIPEATAVDLNRAGTPLVEIVTEPDLRSPRQTRAFLQRLRQLLRYLEVSDCNMEEGSLRVDANVSVRPAQSEALGVKTELKNLNSFSGVEKALRVEIARQTRLLRAGRAVRQETLSWDEAQGRVRSMRSKEESHDYRYFPEPDLPPLVLDPGRVDRVRRALPELPDSRARRFAEALGLPEYDVGVLTSTRSTADWFEAVMAEGIDPKEASNWVMGPVLRAANERALALDVFPVSPLALAELIRLVSDGTIARATSRRVLNTMIETGARATEVVERGDLARISSEEDLEAWVAGAVSSNPDEVRRYRQGEDRLFGFFMGQVMKSSGGRADPQRVRELLGRALAGD